MKTLWSSVIVLSGLLIICPAIVLADCPCKLGATESAPVEGHPGCKVSRTCIKAKACRGVTINESSTTTPPVVTSYPAGVWGKFKEACFTPDEDDAEQEADLSPELEFDSVNE